MHLLTPNQEFKTTQLETKPQLQVVVAINKNTENQFLMLSTYAVTYSQLCLQFVLQQFYNFKVIKLSILLFSVLVSISAAQV